MGSVVGQSANHKSTKKEGFSACKWMPSLSKSRGEHKPSFDLLFHCLGPMDSPHPPHESGLSLSVSGKRLNDELDSLSYQKESKKTMEGNSL